MIYGTHNSGTGGQLLWWLRPLAWLINTTSKCQNKTLQGQLQDGVRLFNLQVTRYRGKWVFSHGLAIYQEELIPTLCLMRCYATREKPIYFNLFLDDNLLLWQPDDDFRELLEDIKDFIKDSNVKLLYAWIEGEKEVLYNSGIKLSYEEHYWTMSWAKKNAKSLLDYLPLPKRHAKKYNETYKSECKGEFLMLDFYNYD